MKRSEKIGDYEIWTGLGVRPLDRRVINVKRLWI